MKGLRGLTLTYAPPMWPLRSSTLQMTHLIFATWSGIQVQSLEKQGFISSAATSTAQSAEMTQVPWSAAYAALLAAGDMLVMLDCEEGRSTTKPRLLFGGLIALPYAGYLARCLCISTNRPRRSRLRGPLLAFKATSYPPIHLVPSHRMNTGKLHTVLREL